LLGWRKEIIKAEFGLRKCIEGDKAGKAND
jgi:hypothetical protein